MNTLTHRGHLFDDLLREVAPSYYVRPLHGDPLPHPSQIKMDVKDTPTAYLVHAEIPGVGKDDIHIHIDGNVVTLSAEVKQQDSSNRDEKVLRSERYFGSVSRSFQLPLDLDREESKATFENGILTLTLQKKKHADSSRRLHID